MTPKEAFSKNLKRALDEQDIPYTKVDMIAGISKGLTSRTVHGRNVPRLDTAWKMARVAGATLDQLMEGAK